MPPHPDALHGSGNQKLSALWTLDPTQAKRIVLRALADAEGNVTHAAEALKIYRTTLWRWIKEGKLGLTIEEIHAKYAPEEDDDT